MHRQQNTTLLGYEHVVTKRGYRACFATMCPLEVYVWDTDCPQSMCSNISRCCKPHVGVKKMVKAHKDAPGGGSWGAGGGGGGGQAEQYAWTGKFPAAVSPDSMTQSEPSSTALATSVASARVGRGFLTMDSSICVAVITGLPAYITPA